MARSKWISFGAQEALKRAAGNAAAPPIPSTADAKKFGLENFGNTCYANSVLQALYFCTPFRDLLLQELDTAPSSPTTSSALSKPLAPVRRKSERKPSTGHALEGSSSTPVTPPHPIPSSPPTLFSALRSLFLNISTNPGEKGTVSPRAFIDKLKELNEHFRSTMHQDAHEFLNYLLNQIVEEIEEERKQAQNGISVNAVADDLSGPVATLASKSSPTLATNGSNSGTRPRDATLVHKLFEGVLTSETRCLTCETVSSRDESFLDLSIDIEQNSSVTACLRQFSASEMLCQRNKFFCDSCCDLQEAEKRMKIKKLPNVLALHLKRFKYQEDVAKYIKLAYRVAFPFELRLFNTVDDMEDADRLYNLFAIVVHIGNGPHHGHYISIVKTFGTWLVFDDDNVSLIQENDIPKYFGDSNSGSAYVLYYQAVDIDLVGLGLRTPEPPVASPEPNKNSVPLPQPSPAFTSQPSPTLPPGLDFIPDLEAELHPLQPPPIFSSPPLDMPDKFLAPISIPHADHEFSPSLSSVPAASSPVAPSGFGSKIINTMRRAPSMSATRGSIGNLPNPSDARKSMTEGSPRPSASSPQFTDGSAPEQPPPLPPLPPTVLNQNQLHPNASPSYIPQVNEPEKEKSRSASAWLNRKLRALDKSRQEQSYPHDLPPSPIITKVHPETQSPQANAMSWFKSGPSSNHASQLQRRPSENGSSTPNGGPRLRPHYLRRNTSVLVTENVDKGRRLNGNDGSHSAGPVSSPPGSTFQTAMSSMVANVSMPGSRPSANITSSGPSTGIQISRPSTSVSQTSSGQSESHPVRKHSIVPPSGDHTRSSLDRKSLDLKQMLPLARTPDHHRNLSPLPPTPRHTHQSNSSNGHVDFDGQLRIGDNGDVILPPGSSRSLGVALGFESATLPPNSLAGSIGTNHSSGSNNSSSSNVKRPTRKLSLTAPILFGRKDKDKLKEREEDSLSPNSYNKI